MSDQLKIAVIGVGNMGTAHAYHIAEGKIAGLELAALCDSDKGRRTYCEKSFPGVPFYENWKDLIDNSSAQAILVAVPHRLHALIAGYSLKKGLHTLVEKPVDIKVSAAIELNKIAEKSGKVFGIVLNQRTDFLFKKAREIVQSGKLGELKRTVWIVTNWYRTQSYYNSSDWRATWSGEGGGVLINQAPHNLDILQWISGMPESVTAFCDVGKYHNIEVEDEASLFLRYKNGATATFLTSTGEYPGTNRLEISGTLGKLVLDAATLKWWRLKDDERNVCYGSKQSFAEIPMDYTEYKDSAVSGHQIILQNFANAILFGEKLIAPGTDGINELILSNAAYLSQWKGNAEIRLPFDCAEFDRELTSHAREEIRRDRQPVKVSASEYQERWNVRW